MYQTFYLFPKHECDDLNNMEGELSLVFRTGQEQEEILQTTHMEGPGREQQQGSDTRLDRWATVGGARGELGARGVG